MDNYQFKAKLYGVRGSYPISPSEGTKIGGNTTCLLVRTNEHIIIFDAGSGIIQLGRDLIPEIIEHNKTNKEPFQISIIFTHTHSDHLMGFPFFIPLYMAGAHLHFFGPATLGQSLEETLSRLVDPQYFPVGMQEFQSKKSFYDINESNFIYFNPGNPVPQLGRKNETEAAFSDIIVNAMKYYFHPKDGTLVYRVEWNDKKLVLATDVEEYSGCDQRLINFAKDADVLIHDAQYTPEQYKLFNGYGHSNYEMACQAAKLANVKKLLLFHHDPGNDDEQLKEIEQKAKKIFTDTELATEKWEWLL